MDNSLLQLQIILGFLALLLFLWRISSNRNKTRDPPEPAGAWPIIGHLHKLEAYAPFVHTLGTMADKYGPIFSLRFGMGRTIVVSGWEIAKECFTVNDKVLATRPRTAAGKYMGYDYAMLGIAPYGPYWREVRKITTVELLSNYRLQALKDLWSKEIEICISQLYKVCGVQPVKVDMKQWFEDLSFNVISMIITGKRFSGTEAEEDVVKFREATKKSIYLSGLFVPSDVYPVLDWFDIGGHKKVMKSTARELDSTLTSWVEDHRRKKLSGDNSKGSGDFIDVMLSVLKDDKVAGYDPETVIKATSLTLILGATDTTTVTLTWALSLLLNDRNVLKKAQDELDSYVGKERPVDESDIKNLVYLQAIVKETLRLYPAVPFLVPHEATEDCQIGGYDIRAGTRVLVNLWKMQQDPLVWSDPKEFRPERFLTSQAGMDFRGQHFQFIPFGSGRRVCPGISFGLQVIHLTLARLLHEFELATPSNLPVDMTSSIGVTIIKDTPLQVIFTTRLPSKLYKE